MDALSAIAPQHVPGFIVEPGGSDWLMTVVGVTLIAAVLAAGVFFFWLHSLPERMVHNKVQFDIVAVLALLSLFTHIHAFWVAALIIALIDFSNFSFPHFAQSLGSIAGSLEKMAAAQTSVGGVPAAASAVTPKPAPAPSEALPDVAALALATDGTGTGASRHA